MQNLKFTLPVLILFFFPFLNCYNIINGPTYGYLFSDIQFAGEVNPSNEVRPEKKAIGCQHNILLLFSWGNSAAGRIAKKSNIKRIARIDHSAKNIFIIYTQYCTLVYGE